MSITGLLKNAGQSAPVKYIRAVLECKYFPFLLTALSILCYYTGLDLVMIYAVGITMVLTLLFADDGTPVICALLFTCILISDKNSPSIHTGNAQFYFNKGVLAQIFIVIILSVAAGVLRLVCDIADGRFKLTPIFAGVAALAGVMLINGIFSSGYQAKNMLYGLIMALCLVGIFTLIRARLRLDGQGFIKIAYCFAAFSMELVFELFIKYLTADGIIRDGAIIRTLIVFGWGTWNTLGAYLVICIPFVLLLAAREKYGFIFTLYSFVLFAAAIFSCSRQNILGACVIYPASLAVMLVKCKNRYINLGISGGIIVIALIIALVSRNTVNYFIDLFSQIRVDGELSGNGRVQLWREAIAHFKSAPIFGVGFYAQFSYSLLSGLDFIPAMCHNTVLELLSACGIVGLAVYLLHRVQTVLSYVKHITFERTMLALAAAVLLAICLIDNHIFNIFPTIIYACMVAMLDASQIPCEESAQEVPENEQET